MLDVNPRLSCDILEDGYIYIRGWTQYINNQVLAEGWIRMWQEWRHRVKGLDRLWRTSWRETKRKREREKYVGAQKIERSREDLISKSPLHYSPWEVRPPQVDWSDLARSIIYIATRGESTCVWLALAVSYHYVYHLGEKNRGHSADRLIDGWHELRIST